MIVTGAVAAAGTGCGGGGPSQEERAAEQAEQRAQTQWRNGLTRWSNQMISALIAISVMFSDVHTVDLLQRGDALVAARLDRLERKLAGCTSAVERLGPPPELYEPAHRQALRACGNLEKGTRQVRAGIAEWQQGLTQAALNEATATLGEGQSGVLRARTQLRTS